MGFDDWNTAGHDMPHNPAVNQLRYLNQYSKQQAESMLTDPAWTRAIFLREPHERFLSAFLDKAMNNNYVKSKCHALVRTLDQFITVSQSCRDPHWAAQIRRVDAKWIPYINVVGHMNSESVRAMLGPDAWEIFGASGWGASGNETIFQSNALKARASGASEKMERYWEPEVLERFDKRFEAELLWYAGIEWTAR